MTPQPSPASGDLPAAKSHLCVDRSLFQFLWITRSRARRRAPSRLSTVIGADVSATCDWEDWVCCPADVVVSWCLWPDPQCDAGTSGTCDCCRERVPQTLDQQVPPDGAVRR